MSLVVDASVAFKWFVPSEEYAVEATALLRNEAALIAPDIVVAEVCNTAWRCSRLGRIAAEHADRIAAVLPTLFDSLVGSTVLAPRATAIAREIDHPLYDCLYLALAEAQAIPLITADASFLNRLAGTRWQAAAKPLA